jgi:hypothetical protein
MNAIPWKPQQFRLTVFPSKVFDVPEPGWWVKLLGELPEEKSIKSKGLSQVESGKFHEGRLELSTSAARIDWTYSAQISGENEPDFSAGIPTLGSFEASLADFKALAGRWVKEMCPPISRIAFGAVLSQPVDSHEQGYEVLKHYLPRLEIDPKGSFDFLYQINRPRVSKCGISDLRINRLSKWAVAAIQAHIFTAGKSMTMDMGGFATRLELDFSTHQNFEGDLPVEKVPSIFDELVTLGGEVASLGDIP